MREADTVTKTGRGRRGRKVLVIGGGIAGLAAAHRLLDGSERGGPVHVTVLEADERLGGKLHTGEIAGARVDLGAESMLARRPEAVGLAREVGLGDRLQPPSTATASIWTRGALRPMPKGHVMGVPGTAEALEESSPTRACAASAATTTCRPPTSARTSPSAGTSPHAWAARSSTGSSNRCSAASTRATPT